MDKLIIPGSPAAPILSSSKSNMLKRTLSNSCNNCNDDYKPNQNPQALNSPSRLLQSISKSPSKRFKSSSPHLDRFIPNRQNVDFENCNVELMKVDESYSNDAKVHVTKNKLANLEILTPNKSKRMVDVFESTTQQQQQNKKPLETTYFRSSNDSSQGTPSSTMMSASKKKLINRILPSKPSRILDAPDLVDDYYLNLLDWGPNNIVAIALRKSVYLWHADVGKIDHLLELEDGDDLVTSVQWSDTSSGNANTLAVGTNNNTVQIWDTVRLSQVREMTGHSARVSSLSWNKAIPNMISSGSRDSLILHHDIRAPRRLPFQYIGHQQEVCGLQWSPDGRMLASGGNENVICLWDAAMSGTGSRRGSSSAMGGGSGGLNTSFLNNSSTGNNNTSNLMQQYRIPLSPYSITVSDVKPLHILRDHQAAVRALAWCPWENKTLASGGGTADRNIKLWNTTNGTCIHSVDTGSQVCALQWNETYKELLSSHGFSDNQLILWKYPTMTKIKEFRGHTSRVLHMTQCKTTGTICTASADETLRFWDIFSKTAPSVCHSPFPLMMNSNSSNNSNYGSSSSSIGASVNGTGGTTPVLMRSSCNTLSIR